MQYVPSEMERRYRLYITGRGDSGASLFRCLHGRGEGSSAWAAHVLSRIYLVKGRIGLARSYLDLSTRLFERSADGRVPPGLEVNRALLLWSAGDGARAERLLREVLARALERGDTFVAAKAASNLSMILARTRRPSEAAPLNGLAEICYRARRYEEGIVRTGLTGALIEHASGRHGEAVDRISRILSRARRGHLERERAAGASLLSEVFLDMDDIERAGEALKLAYASRRALRRFRPVRLGLLALSARCLRRRGEVDRAERLELRAERMKRELGLYGVEYEAPGRSRPVHTASDPARISREAPVLLRLREGAPRLITGDPLMRRLLAEIRGAAPLPAPVLIRGETGVGKELVGRLIHEWSGRGRAPFVPVNAAAFTRELFESTLFGHARGAFTGAVAERRGLLVEAGTGTLFLDEIAELDTALQAKLLRFLDSGEYMPVGSDRRRISVARVVAATNRDLEDLMNEGKFRNDLFYRFSVLTFRLPPLRERRGDIPLLADHFLARAAGRPGLGPFSISDEARALLVSYDWPGNVRELDGEILRAAVRARRGVIRVGHLSARLIGCVGSGKVPSVGGLDRRISEYERGEIECALRAVGGNRSEAARVLGLKRTTLLYRMKRHGIGGDPDPSRVD